MDKSNIRQVCNHPFLKDIKVHAFFSSQRARDAWKILKSNSFQISKAIHAHARRGANFRAQWESWNSDCRLHNSMEKHAWDLPIADTEPFNIRWPKNASFPPDQVGFMQMQQPSMQRGRQARDGVGDWVRKLNSLIRAGQGRGLSLIWGMPDSTHPPGALPRVIRPWSPKLPW